MSARRRGCTCTPGKKCELCTNIGRAILRMFRLHTDVNRHADPVGFADMQTSMHDARCLISLARGVPLELIDRNGYTPAAWKEES